MSCSSPGAQGFRRKATREKDQWSDDIAECVADKVHPVESRTLDVSRNDASDDAAYSSASVFRIQAAGLVKRTLQC